MIDMQTLGRLLAHERGKAVVTIARKRVTVMPDAIILSTVALSGEESTVHAVAIGRNDERPRVLSVPDPRNREDMFGTLVMLGGYLEERYRECMTNDGPPFPQVWVPSSSVADNIEAVSERLRFSDKPEDRRAGNILAYLVTQKEVPGQQSLMVSTRVLSDHFATGQSPMEDEHLGALLAWVDPPEGIPAIEAAREAEKIPLGASTLPEFDKNVLAPLVDRFNQLGKENPPDEEGRRQLAAAIHREVGNVVVRSYEATRRAYRIMKALSIPDLPDLTNLMGIESMSFQNFMHKIDENIDIRVKDSPRSAVFGLAMRESASSQYTAALRIGDEMARSEAKIAGKVLEGILLGVESGKTLGSPRLVFEIESRQECLRFRKGDSLECVSGPEISGTVLSVRRSGVSTVVTAELVSPRPPLLSLEKGICLEFVPDKPDWGWGERTRDMIARRLASPPWTHAKGGQPPKSRANDRGDLPADPLHAVESMRAPK